MRRIYPKSIHELSQLVAREKSILLVSARTGTVIAYDHLEQACDDNENCLLDLMQLPQEIIIGDDLTVEVVGPVSWKELKTTLRSQGLDVCVWPTEESASVLAGVATSCSGERSFHYGAFRNQVLEVSFMDSKGVVHRLCRQRALQQSPLLAGNEKIHQLLVQYQKKTLAYQKFKNPPFPRLENETDLAIAQEGQLGINLAAKIRITPYHPSLYLVMALESWREEASRLVEVYQFLQKQRSYLLAAEFIEAKAIDSCFAAVNQQQLDKWRAYQKKDCLILEVREDKIDHFYSQLQEAKIFDLEKIEVVEQKEVALLRASVPRYIQEAVSQRGLLKIGTDAQFSQDSFAFAIKCYQQMAERSPCPTFLFGHFGDNHLHFNFLPEANDHHQVQLCHQILRDFYLQVKSDGGSPFTEHGIGILKMPYIDSFVPAVVTETLAQLKGHLDGDLRFFPQGLWAKYVKKYRGERI